MTLPPLLTLLLAIPTLLLGEWIVRRVKFLRDVNIPVSVVGGFLVAVLLLTLHFTPVPLKLATDTAAPVWTWWTTAGLYPFDKRQKLILPLLVIFYTTLGLSASWEMVRKGGLFLVIFLISTAFIALLQNGVGAGLAKLLGQPPALGLLCGSISLMGGFSTSLGFADPLAKQGVSEAIPIGIAAATFGLVISNVISAPLGTWLIRRRHLSAEDHPDLTANSVKRETILHEIARVGYRTRSLWLTLLLLLTAAKASAFVTTAIENTGIVLPSQVGAMIIGLLVRNLHDALGLRLLDLPTIDRIGSITLSLFLAIAMMTLDLTRLGTVAGPMLVLLLVQTLLTSAYALVVNFRLMGKSYEAAITSSGLTGFALGATPNAIAAMQSLTRRFGPAPKAFLIVPVTGAFLSDVINIAIITVFINALS